MAADPEPEAPPLGPERSRESLPDESLDLDERAVESPRTEPQDPAGDASHARGVDDASRSARHQVVTSATPSHGSSVIDAVVDAAVDASMETEEARLEDVFSGKDDEADDEADARVVSSAVPAAPTPPSLERRAPPPPAPRGRGASGRRRCFETQTFPSFPSTKATRRYLATESKTVPTSPPAASKNKRLRLRLPREDRRSP